MKISYKTSVDRPRTGSFGRALRWMGRHPIAAGTIGGIAAVAMAASRAFGGVQSAPMVALVISAVVVAVWAGLFYMLGGFFTRQSIRIVQVQRHLIASDEQLRWTQDGETLRHIDRPDYTLYTNEVPDEMLEAGHVDKPWPVWLVATGNGGRFVAQSKVTAGEASAYPPVDPQVVDHTDEVIPTGLASALLSCAERFLGKSRDG